MDRATDNTGQPPITDYQYQYKKTDESFWSGITYFTGGATTVVINGLEAGKSYHVEVLANNDEGPGPWSPTGVGKTNSLPDFSGATAGLEVDENTWPGQNIGNPVIATDDDTGDTLTYTLEGTDKDSFQIVSNTGQIQTKATLDYEATASYSVTVKADDSNSGTATIDVTIDVTDVNETPEFDEEGATTRSIPENTAADTSIGGAS